MARQRRMFFIVLITIALIGMCVFFWFPFRQTVGFFDNCGYDHDQHVKNPRYYLTLEVPPNTYALITIYCKQNVGDNDAQNRRKIIIRDQYGSVLFDDRPKHEPVKIKSETNESGQPYKLSVEGYAYNGITGKMDGIATVSDERVSIEWEDFLWGYADCNDVNTIFEFIP